MERGRVRARRKRGGGRGRKASTSDFADRKKRDAERASLLSMASPSLRPHLRKAPCLRRDLCLETANRRNAQGLASEFGERKEIENAPLGDGSLVGVGVAPSLLGSDGDRGAARGAVAAGDRGSSSGAAGRRGDRAEHGDRSGRRRRRRKKKRYRN